MDVRRGLARIGSAFVCAGCVGAAQADIYAFTDDHGGVHLSNVPADERYTLLVAGERPVAAASAPSGAAAGKPMRFGALIGAAAQTYQLDTALLHAVIAAESNYDPRAISKKGAAGLMQLMPDTARRYGVADPLDPLQNLDGGAHYLRDLLAMFNQDLSLTLAAYNAGENAVLRHGKRVPPYRETAAYVPKVIALYRKYRGGT